MLLLLLVLVVAVFNDNASVVVQYKKSRKNKIFFDVVTTVAAPIVAQFEFSFATTISICELICVALAVSFILLSMQCFYHREMGLIQSRRKTTIGAKEMDRFKKLKNVIASHCFETKVIACTQYFTNKKDPTQQTIPTQPNLQKIINMGRKQRLRQEKRNIKNKAAAAEVTAATAVATTSSTKDAIVEMSTERVLAQEDQLPESDVYGHAININISYGEQYELFKRGITEDECVHSMQAMGEIFLGQWELTMNSFDGINRELTMDTTDKKRIHLALPWYLEGAIRGSVLCTRVLMGEFYIQNAAALHGYWGEIYKKYYSERGFALVEHKDLKDLVERKCVICSKTDTETLTLKQCKGCSAYCYCGELCQTIHWKERKHRNECKQVHILNKYHKPYFNEIRDAVIRGDKEIPSLEKLRYKLGLTRPQEEYVEFFERTHNGKKINSDDYLVGREDGTLWVGSVPNSPIGRNDTIVVLPTLYVSRK